MNFSAYVIKFSKISSILLCLFVLVVGAVTYILISWPIELANFRPTSGAQLVKYFEITVQDQKNYKKYIIREPYTEKLNEISRQIRADLKSLISFNDDESVSVNLERLIIKEKSANPQLQARSNETNSSFGINKIYRVSVSSSNDGKIKSNEMFGGEDVKRFSSKDDFADWILIQLENKILSN